MAINQSPKSKFFAQLIAKQETNRTELSADLAKLFEPINIDTTKNKPTDSQHIQNSGGGEGTFMIIKMGSANYYTEIGKQVGR